MPGPGGRTEEFADAALRLVARGGLQAVSVRTVAAEAGWSAGALQKVFATKEDLLRAAVDLMDRRVQERLHHLPLTGAPVDDLLALVEETLPLDERRRDEALVWTAFSLEAARTPWIAEVLHAQTAAVLHDLTGLLGGDAAAARTAQAVVALADGFAVRLLHSPEAVPAAREALRASLRTLLAAL
ncbi:TetR/AcrR family transcriptional regulator [Kineococcus arenarius]|uniref:TetR/AcrR family transcriptional regulator n=1 Tax=unclassified Kineococcus TaxID=2621656 RepID=UPI003D7EA04F